MDAPESASQFGLFSVREFFDAPTCERIISETRAARGGPATVYRPNAPTPVDERLRKTTRYMLSTETTEFVRRRIMERKEEVERHFGVRLNDCEDPQFLFYQVGDFFVPHEDGNTEQLQFDHLRVRRISVVIFLSRQSEEPGPGAFGGGSLVIFGPRVGTPRRELGFHVRGETGLFVAFRAETTHEVTPVTHGERYSIVCWYR